MMKLIEKVYYIDISVDMWNAMLELFRLEDTYKDVWVSWLSDTELYVEAAECRLVDIERILAPYV